MFKLLHCYLFRLSKLKRNSQFSRITGTLSKNDAKSSLLHCCCRRLVKLKNGFSVDCETAKNEKLKMNIKILSRIKLTRSCSSAILIF